MKWKVNEKKMQNKWKWNATKKLCSNYDIHSMNIL